MFFQQFGVDSKNAHNMKIPVNSELRRNFYSVPDLVQITICNKVDNGATLSRNHKSQDNVNDHDNLSTEDSSSSSSQLSHISNVKIKNKSNIYSQCPTSIASQKGMHCSYHLFKMVYCVNKASFHGN